LGPVKRGFRHIDSLDPDVLMALVASGLGIVAENTPPWGEVPPVQELAVECPPLLRGGVIFRRRGAPGHRYLQRPLPVQLGLLYLLAAPRSEEDQQEKHPDEHGFTQTISTLIQVMPEHFINVLKIILHPFGTLRNYFSTSALPRRS
jgi:hypothetical protein